MKHILIPAALVAATTGSAHAMQHCGDRETVVQTLSETYAETHRASGLQSTTGLLEIWASDVDGSWTILMTRPDGQTCVMATGTHWLDAIPQMVAMGEPA